jgi:hypothetical protein
VSGRLEERKASASGTPDAFRTSTRVLKAALKFVPPPVNRRLIICVTALGSPSVE